jgi:hypothetical protein
MIVAGNMQDYDGQSEVDRPQIPRENALDPEHPTAKAQMYSDY